MATRAGTGLGFGMTSRYEISVWKADVPFSRFGGKCDGADEVWYALVWDGRTGTEVEEFAGKDRHSVLQQAARKRATLEENRT